MPHRPPPSVLTAFGVDQPPEHLAGGQGESWRAGGLVLKPGSGPVHESLCGLLADLVSDEVRLPAPVRTRDGAWSHEGWSATAWLDGSAPDHSSPAATKEVLEAGRAFHRATALLERPGFLDAREDPWAVADRVAWDEAPMRFLPQLAGVADRLGTAIRPLGPDQLVHGDLTGNVLLAPRLRPAVIDLSLYWRPPEYADAVVVADALCWHGAGVDLLDVTSTSVAGVARALLFRLATTQLRLLAGADVDLTDEARRYRSAASALGL